MNPPKAIEILAHSAYAGCTSFDQDFKDAEKLGIEALHYVLRDRQGLKDCEIELLPGETD